MKEPRMILEKLIRKFDVDKRYLQVTTLGTMLIDSALADLDAYYKSKRLTEGEIVNKLTSIYFPVDEIIMAEGKKEQLMLTGVARKYAQALITAGEEKG